jgi:hypothetical protein
MAIKPPSSRLTPEAQEHLRTQGMTMSDNDDTVSDADLSTPYIINGNDDTQYFSVADDDEPPTPDVGSVIDNAIHVESSPVEVAKPEPPITTGFGRRRRKNPGDPKKTAPDTDEWMDFFSRIVIRFLTEWYVDWMFRGIGEDSVTDIDAAKLALTEDERDVIARPYAEFANKNPFLKKHGRQIVAFSDSFESTVILGKFFMRVNRIARKYKPQEKKPQRPSFRLHPEQENNHNGNRGQGQESAESTQGPIPDGYPIFNPGGS